MENKKSQSTKTCIALFSGLFVIILVRILPAIGQPLYVYGYDYGFYRYAVQHVAPLSLQTIFTGISGGYNNPLFYIFSLLRIPVDASLMVSHFLAGLLLGLAVFLFLKKYGVLASWFGTILTAFSLVQLESYTMFLWKTGLALPLFVWGLTSIRYKKYIHLTIVTLLLLITHRTSAIIFLLTLGTYLLIKQLQNKQWKWLGVEATVFGLVIILFWTQITHTWSGIFTVSDQYFVRDGIFFYGQSKLAIMWPYLLIGAYGLYHWIKTKQTWLLPILAFTTTAWILLHLPFYNRVLIYFDIALIILSAYALAVLFHRYKSNKIFAGMFCLCIIIIGYRATHAALTKPMLITQTEIQEIKSFKINEQVPFVLATSANDAPWLLGFLTNTRLGAPGLFEDKHTENEWQVFWQGQNQKEFLATFPKPLYLYQRSFPITATGQCFKPITENFLLLTCK